MTPNQEREALAEHGTKLIELKPANVVQAAEADIARRARNVERFNGGRYAGQFEPCAFHKDHVEVAQKGGGAAELIALAIADPDRGIESGKRNTRLLYRDRDLLGRALESLKRSRAAQ